MSAFFERECAACHTTYIRRATEGAFSDAEEAAGAAERQRLLGGVQIVDIARIEPEELVPP